MDRSYIPAGYHSVSPYLVVSDAHAALEFYQHAFDALVTTRLEMPDGSIGHAEIRIGDSIIMLGSARDDAGFHAPEYYGGSSASLFLYVPDADATFAQALQAGAVQEQALTNMFWGDRLGKLRDPFGYIWSVATQVEQVHHEEVKQRLLQMYAEPAD